MPDTHPLEQRLAQVRNRIRHACERAGRAADDVSLLAVSKTRAAGEIAALYQLGQRAFGENYVDEAGPKQDALDLPSLEWHFIGPIQSNKTRRIAERFDWVQSVDRIKLVRRLGEQRPPDQPPLNVLLQVNVDDEAQKAGCAPEELAALAAAVAEQPALRLRGLMAIPAPHENPDAMRPAFARLRGLFDALAAEYASLDTLSMGMSSDLEAAIAEGATLVRVGTALFGPRP